MLASVLLCRPDYFRVDYQINPWMSPGSVNFSKAQEQWQRVKEVYGKLGVTVYQIPQVYEWPDMVFAADQGILLKDYQILLSRFRYPERSGETKVYQEWLAERGFECFTLPENIVLEGYGEVLPGAKGSVFVAHGFRNSPNLPHYLAEKIGLEVFSLELVNSAYYHLDTCLFILNEKVAFYYPQAFSRQAIKLLQNKFASLYEIPEKEAKNFAANSVVVGQNVLMQEGNPHTEQQIASLGYHPISIDVSEFMKAGGGIHCLTLPLSFSGDGVYGH